MKLPRVTSLTKQERRALKEWLTSVIPQDMSRNDVAEELGVTRRTISSMLNPNAEEFPGLTMLRYLQLAGAVTAAPTASPASSRLARLEAQVAELPTKADLQAGLDVLRAAIHAQATQGTQQGTAAEQATGTDG